MIGLEDIKALHMEISSRCVAGCPFCSRSQKVRAYKGLLITLDEFKRLPASMLRRLKRLTLGGNFGDLSSNPEMPAIMAYLRELNPELLAGGHSNGAAQDPEWWRELGSAWGEGYMVFCIDGLKNTHARYRKGTDFDRVIANLRAFVQGGGQAHWQYLVFEHNQHQIEQARELARSLGCARFFAMPSRDYDQDLRPPAGIEIKHKREHLAKSLSRLDEADQRALCKPLHKGTLYIAADGTVHPCCLAHCMYISEHNQDFAYIVPLIEKHRDSVNFKTKPLEEIIQGPYFKAVFKTAPGNPYCQKKCNRLRDQLKQEIYVEEAWFQEPAQQAGGAVC